MMLTKYVRPIGRGAFDRQVSDLFDEAFRAVGGFKPTGGIRWNVYEKDDRFCIDAAVPGFTANEVDLKVSDGTLTVSATRRAEDTDDGTVYFVREFGCDTMSRSMTLPDHLDLEKATAVFKDGILTVGFPKRAESLPRRIPIEPQAA